jgi:hypothetical protein
MFKVLMGIPEMKNFWDDLVTRKKEDSLSADENELFKKISTAIKFLAADPRHCEGTAGNGYTTSPPSG